MYGSTELVDHVCATSKVIGVVNYEFVTKGMIRKKNLDTRNLLGNNDFLLLSSFIELSASLFLILIYGCLLSNWWQFLSLPRVLVDSCKSNISMNALFPRQSGKKKQGWNVRFDNITDCIVYSLCCFHFVVKY